MHGIKAIDESGGDLNQAQCRDGPNEIRGEYQPRDPADLIEQKLDHSIGQQTEASKTLRDELGGNFQRLGSRVSESLTEIESAPKRAIRKRHRRTHWP